MGKSIEIKRRLIRGLRTVSLFVVGWGTRFFCIRGCFWWWVCSVYLYGWGLLSFESVQWGWRVLGAGHRSIRISKWLNKYLITSELDPPLIMKLLIKPIKDLSIDKVDKPIPNIAVILNLSYVNYLNITRQVQKVISIGKVKINLIRQVLNGILIRYIPNHQRGPGVMTDGHGVDLKVIRIVIKCLVA